jgi:signal transduction histidine kinase
VRAHAPAAGGADSPASTADGQALPSSRRSRRRLKDWRVRSRLLLLIAVPTLAALVLGGARIYSSVQSALLFQRAEERAVLASAIPELTQRLETERDQSVYYIALGNTGRAGVLSARVPAADRNAALQQYSAIKAFYRQTDQAIARFRALVGRFRGAYSPAARQKIASALAGLNNLQYLRQASTKGLLYPLGVVQKYTTLIDDLITIDDETAQGTGDPVLSQTVQVLGWVSRMKEEASQQRAIFSAALLAGKLTPLEATALSRAQANQQDGQQAFDLAATPAQRELWNNSVSGSFIDLAASEEQQAGVLQARQHSLASESMTAAGFYDAMSTGIDDQMGSVERTLAGDLVTRSNSLRASALASAIVVGLTVFVLLALALTFTVVVGGSLTGPLRRLRMGALEVAGARLPDTVRKMGEDEAADAPLDVEPIDVASTDEIGDVARAFDQVHREAVRLAANEAGLRGTVNAMFVNLSRRSQSLVERQIRLIDDLEQGEQEPERLANLFQMDHLATRMRRNSENLLVLAGHDVTARWTQAVALIDVARAAVSEIEQYERVTLDIQPGFSVRGPAVSDVVHLLSELVENATSFSAGDLPVSVSAHQLGSGGVLFAITDQGVGMSEEEMAHANWRLDNPPVVDVAVSRRMGLFVVARLAARHGIRVRLRPGSGNGLVALVWLPDEVLTQDAGTAPPQPRHPQAETAEAVAARTGAAGTGPAPDAPMRASHALAAVPAPAAGHAPVAGAVPVAEPVAASAAELRLPGHPHDVILPPAAATGMENKLPIFESVESDWFRRGRRGLGFPAPAVAPAPSGWASPADEGWRAAEVAGAPVTGGTTVAGLPKRVPRANLVPGGVDVAPVPAEVTAARSPAQTRDRLASFQRGIREARAAARDDDVPSDGEADGA